MKKLTITLFIMGIIPLTLCAQDNNFSNAVSSLQKQLQFRVIPTADPNNPTENTALFKKLMGCSQRENLKSLELVDFTKFTQIKSCELYTNKWDNNTKSEIAVQEWNFKTPDALNDFVALINGDQKKDIQLCLNKEGIFWFTHKNRLYIVTSKLNSVTNHYNEIKEAMLLGLNQ